MKKILTFTLAITIALTGMAQGKSNGKGHAKKSDKHQRHSDRNDHDDDDDRDGRDRDGRDRDWRDRDGRDRDGRDRDGRHQTNRNNTGKYSKNLPSKVRAAFNNDYPNATNVSWTKSNGNWTATFPNGLYRKRVTYAANGQRVNNNRSTSSSRTNTQNGSIWDKIMTKE